MKKHTKRFFLLALFIAVIVALQFSGAREVLTFENLKKNRDALLSMVKEHYAASVLTYIGVYIVAIALNAPGAAILTIAGGFLFGTVFAVLYANVGATTGAVLAFLSSRYLLGEWVQNKYHVQLARFNREMEINGPRYLLTLRLIPIFPFFMINFLSGLTKMPLKTFVWTTSVGIIPAAVVFAYAGRQIGSIGSPGEILSPKVITAFVLLALLALVPGMISRRKGRKSRLRNNDR
jgi:uncharacterized membrane protein YdjX (TVP38/TMEM64 family)